VAGRGETAPHAQQVRGPAQRPVTAAGQVGSRPFSQVVSGRKSDPVELAETCLETRRGRIASRAKSPTSAGGAGGNSGGTGTSGGTNGTAGSPGRNGGSGS
jgi:hypothetical protein